MTDFIVRIVGILLIGIGMYWLGRMSTVAGIGVGLLLVIGTVVTLFPSIFTLDDPD